MRFFSKKITTDRIVVSLIGLFEISYNSLMVNFKDSFRDKQIIIDQERNKEILVVPMFAIIRATMLAFGDTFQTKDIIGKFQHDIFNKHFQDVEEKNQFGKLFWERCNEYSEILYSDEKNIVPQFGQIFCNHFFNKQDDISNADIMFFIGEWFLKIGIDVKKLLDQISSQTEITK